LILVVKLSQYFNTPEEEPGQHFRKRIALLIPFVFLGQPISVGNSRRFSLGS
jgi:hypothetical protein